MDDVFALCAFKTPSEGANDALKFILSEGMPVNIKVGELREQTEFDPEAGLLHLITTYAEPSQFNLACQMIDTAFAFGANWMLLDSQNRTPGCIAYNEKKLPLYEKFVQAGFRSEIMFQKFVEDSDEEGDSDDNGEEPHGEPHEEPHEEPHVEINAPEADQKTFLQNELKYENHALKTDENDGVMMDWETPIMQRSAEIITKNRADSTTTILNIGFGMGIIDTFIQELKPKKHYIIEAHPAVLKRMREQGWYDKPNVTVLEGTWKDQIPKLLENGVYFDGIYYDTFSEHYKDMLILFDYLVGILDFNGVFSYFNGLGADRQVCYDVYKRVAEFNLKDYGLNLEFEEMPVNLNEGEWKNIKREYFKLDSYSLPIVTFSKELDEEEGELVE